MSKYYGKIGFATSGSTTAGIWEDSVIERYYRGDILQNYRKWEHGESVNDDLNISNRISIVADSFAVNNIYSMKYICFAGNYWKVADISIEYPRLVLTIGGVYNGPKAQSSD